MLEPLRNEPLGADQLPQLTDDDFQPVDANYLRVSLIGIALVAVLAVVGSVVVAVLVPSRPWIPLLVGAVLLLFAGLAALLRTLEVRNIAFQIRDHDVSYRSGVLIKTVSTVPFVRVQHARIRQGPVQRRFGLATLEVNSAGPDLAIDGLRSDTAARLKSLIVERAGDLIEDV